MHERKKEWIDCSPVIDPGLAVWPGDVAFERTWSLLKRNGATVNLSSMRTTLHLGSHADAPLHYDDAGASIDRCPLEPFIGRAFVMYGDEDDRDERGRILPVVIERIPFDLPRRVLFCTDSFNPRQPYQKTFASIAPATIDVLAKRGVVLVGIDTPSVDPLDDTELPTHHRLGAHGMMNLEGLDLAKVRVGFYDMVAVPLRIAGADASPVRVLLRKVD